MEIGYIKYSPITCNEKYTFNEKKIDNAKLVLLAYYHFFV